ncbi:DNA-directed RNA polymerase subunit beta [Streptococcus gallolyticus]|uniref:DNA-directed RNA polymerase subunit beta n=1 Tax=Streptococcus hepaticus TaxID=3349163 RepID=UPI001C959645|nr:DNA-directed RNA polymerase subunit beta [Streptococcus gallolyticus]MBY5041162.1 DNA-directed RNA polymerase subunit beta [Streptococcus gallolyticus]
MDKENLTYIGKQLLFILVIVILGLILFAAGMMIGYAVIGDGSNPWAILHPDKWQEIISKFTGK